MVLTKVTILNIGVNLPESRSN